MSHEMTAGFTVVPRGRRWPGHDRGLLKDLVAVLGAAPLGLRRWSVMRAMRARRVGAGHDISLKFEDEVERLFKEFCAAEPRPDGDDRPFFRPKDKAGEVWALDAARLPAFLESADEG